MDNKILVHKHLIVRAEAKNPPMDEAVLTEWFKKFIDEIGMKVMMGPYVKYSHMIGNRGNYRCSYYRNISYSNACLGRT
jgi:hypothetical protein